MAPAGVFRHLEHEGAQVAPHLWLAGWTATLAVVIAVVVQAAVVQAWAAVGIAAFAGLVAVLWACLHRRWLGAGGWAGLTLFTVVLTGCIEGALIALDVAAPGSGSILNSVGVAVWECGALVALMAPRMAYPRLILGIGLLVLHLSATAARTADSGYILSQLLWSLYCFGVVAFIPAWTTSHAPVEGAPVAISVANTTNMTAVHAFQLPIARNPSPQNAGVQASSKSSPVAADSARTHGTPTTDGVAPIVSASHPPETDTPRRSLLSRKDEVLIQCVKILQAQASQASNRRAARQVQAAIQVLQSIVASSVQPLLSQLGSGEALHSVNSFDQATLEWVASTLRLQAPALSRAGSRASFASQTSSTPFGYFAHNSMEVMAGNDLSLQQLERILTWEFDVNIFVTGNPRAFLKHAVVELFTRLQVMPMLDANRQGLMAAMDHVQATYSYDPSAPNPYHTAIHALDVTQGVAVMCQEPRVAPYVVSFDLMALLLASIFHDYRHPGVSNNFLMKSRSRIALRYNDTSVLENYHAASAFQVLLSQKFHVFGGLPDSVVSSVREMIIKSILATDLAMSGDYIMAFQTNVVVPLGPVSPLLSDSENRLSMEEDEPPSLDRPLLLAFLPMILKCADVSHPARPSHLHLEWTFRITDEFYRQGDLEQSLAMPISPLCDRRNHNLASSQMGFIEFVVRPAFKAMSALLGHTVWMDRIQANYSMWESGGFETESRDFSAPTNPQQHGVVALMTEHVALPGPNRPRLSLQIDPLDNLMVPFPDSPCSARRPSEVKHDVADWSGISPRDDNSSGVGVRTNLPPITHSQVTRITQIQARRFQALESPASGGPFRSFDADSLVVAGEGPGSRVHVDSISTTADIC